MAHYGVFRWSELVRDVPQRCPGNDCLLDLEPLRMNANGTGSGHIFNCRVLCTEEFMAKSFFRLEVAKRDRAGVDHVRLNVGRQRAFAPKQFHPKTVTATVTVSMRLVGTRCYSRAADSLVFTTPATG